MGAVITSWDSSFVVSLVRDFVLPAIGAGFVLSGLFWVTGEIINVLFGVMKGGL